MEQRIYLRAFEFSDLDKLNDLRNDDYLYMHTGGNKFYISKEYDKKWIEDKIFNNKDQIYLAICLLGQNELIGYTSINDIDFRNRKALWGGIIINKNSSGKGYATEAGVLILQLVFEELGLNKLYSYINESNMASLQMVKKLGFVKEGLVRDNVFKKNQYHNAHLISILKKEYDQIVYDK